MSDNKRSGLGICDVLGIIFIVLKLLGIIDWSWVWVLCPIWGSIALALIILFVCWIAD